MTLQSILVTGASGQLARSLGEATSACGGEAPRLVALGRPELDITQPETLDAAFGAHGPSLIVNCAAYTTVDNAESEEQQAMAVNADGAHSVAKLCARQAIPLIHVSTDYVFDGAKPEPYRETDPTGPTGVYGISKLRGEEKVAATCARHIIVRTAWVYSPFGNNFVRTMLRQAADRADVSVVDDQVGCPTYAPHLADAILELSRRVLREKSGDEIPWGTYHAAGAGETTWFDFAREIFRQSARQSGPEASVHPISTADYPTPAKRPLNSRLDCSAMKDRFGIALPDWRTGVEDCVARILSPLPETGQDRKKMGIPI